MPKHKTMSENLFEKIDDNDLMVNEWTVFGVDANAIYCTLCCKHVPINHGGMEQVNQHVWGKPINLSLVQSFQVHSLNSLRVLQMFNLPNQFILR